MITHFYRHPVYREAKELLDNGSNQYDITIWLLKDDLEDTAVLVGGYVEREEQTYIQVDICSYKPSVVS